MRSLAQAIEHTLLKPDATLEDIRRLCREALEHGFLGVCVNPSRVRDARQLLDGSRVRVVAVVGFPLGASTSEAKVFEAMRAASDGADELDVVINIGAAREGRWDYVRAELAAVATATPGLVHKAIIETSLLCDEDKRLAAEAVVGAGFEFVKTSTGFGGGGATAGDVRLLKDVVGGRAGIKASGGIKSKDQALELIEAGASRIGTSSGVDIAG